VSIFFRLRHMRATARPFSRWPVLATAANVCRLAGRRSLATDEKPKLGFLGMGIMGTAMSANLIKAGFSVTVWNRNPARCQPVVAAGATLAPTARRVVEDTDITFGMLADPAAALAVAFGPDGVVAGIRPGKGYVDVSTVDSATSQQIAHAVTSKGGRYLEAPVSGSKGPAEQGTLIFLTGGDESLFKDASPALDKMGKAKFFLGAVGKGAEMKLVVNMVMGSMVAAYAEGLRLADRTGLRQQDVLEVIGLGAIASPILAMKGPNMVARKYPTAFPLKHQQKDLRLALQLAEQVGQTTPVAAAANELYKVARAKGLEDADFTAVLEALIAGESQS